LPILAVIYVAGLTRRVAAIALALLGFALVAQAGPSGPVAWNTTVNVTGGGWGRMIQLTNGNWLCVSTMFPGGTNTYLAIYRSTDTCRTWGFLSQVNEAGRNLDNGELVALPNGQILLSMRSLIDGVSYRLPVYRSTNNGQVWSYLSNIDASEGAGTRGLWEPDFWVLLDAPAEILQSRKQEVPAEESERQRHAYLDLAAHLHDAVVVDASHTLPHVVAGAESAILRWLEGRLEFRHPELQFEQNPVTARLLQYFCRKKTPVLGKLFRVMLNSDVYCRIHSPILMAHPYGIIIHADAEIGRRVAIMQQVTLGGKDWGVNEAPVIEDDVYVGAGAKVLGAVRVGRGAIVGANAVVTRDVPPYCTVVGANRVVRVPEYASSGADAGQRDNHAPADERLSA